MIRISLAMIITISVFATQRADAGPAMNLFPPEAITFSGGSGNWLGGGPVGEHQTAYYQIFNVGDQSLVVSDMQITGPHAGIIRYDDGACGQGTSCPLSFTIAPGAYAEFHLDCVPVQPGYLSASVEITSNDAGSPAVLSISSMAGNVSVGLMNE